MLWGCQMMRRPCHQPRVTSTAPRACPPKALPPARPCSSLERCAPAAHQRGGGAAMEPPAQPELDGGGQRPAQHRVQRQPRNGARRQPGRRRGPRHGQEHGADEDGQREGGGDRHLQAPRGRLCLACLHNVCVCGRGEHKTMSALTKGMGKYISRHTQDLLNDAAKTTSRASAAPAHPGDAQQAALLHSPRPPPRPSGGAGR